MAYRYKSVETVCQTLAVLNARYGATGFRFADYILPARYYTTLLPMLFEAGAPYELKCELKANIDETKMRLLVDAGFVEVQPGVESFSTRALKQMDKGVTSVQNVYLLLLARKHGLVILYNLLYGLPFDDAEDYETMIRNLRRLQHLDPPSSHSRIQITRLPPCTPILGALGSPLRATTRHTN